VTRVARGGRGPSEDHGVSAILLAAGLSTRFGKTKQLADLDGTTLVRRAYSTLRQTLVGDVVVVVGHRASRVASELRGTSARVVVNEGYGTGIGSSLRVGVSALGDESRAVVVCLADQPFVTSGLINRIIARHRRTGAEVVASVSGDLVSPPVLFGRRLYGELAGLSGDKGAKSVITRHAGFEKVRVRPDVLLDVDSEEDLERARRILKAGGVTGTTGRPVGGP
jgi:molybdenum cofactor cytidylyltransferase